MLSMDLISLAFIIIIAAILIWQLVPFIRARKMQGKPAPDFAEAVDERLKDRKRLLFYFWSPSCAMCRKASPVIESLMQSHDDIVKVNILEQADLTHRFKVLGTPTLVLVNDGKVEKMLLGVQPEKRIKRLLDG
jgi:thioredoxin 1